MVKLQNTTDEPLHFPHVAVFAAKGDKDGKDAVDVSDTDAEILLRNKSLRRADAKGANFKGVEKSRSMKGVETE